MSRFLKCKKLGENHRLVDVVLNLDDILNMNPLTARLGGAFRECTHLHLSDKEMIIFVELDRLVDIMSNSDPDEQIIDLTTSSDYHYDDWEDPDDPDNSDDPDDPDNPIEPGEIIEFNSGGHGVITQDEIDQLNQDGTSTELNESELFDYKLDRTLVYNNNAAGLTTRVKWECQCMRRYLNTGEKVKLIVRWKKGSSDQMESDAKSTIEAALDDRLDLGQILRWRGPIDESVAIRYEVIVEGSKGNWFIISHSKYWVDSLISFVNWTKLKKDVKNKIDNLGSGKYLYIQNELSGHNGNYESSTTTDTIGRIKWWVKKKWSGDVDIYAEWGPPNGDGLPTTWRRLILKTK